MRGYVSAYDAESGKLDWRWYVVPAIRPSLRAAELEQAARPGRRVWKTGGGGAMDSIIYDRPPLRAGGHRQWRACRRHPLAGRRRSPYLSSIVGSTSIPASTCGITSTPNESWITTTLAALHGDLSSTAATPCVMQAPKNGFFYVLDAKSASCCRPSLCAGVNWARGIDKKTGRPIVNPQARYDRLRAARW